MTDIYNGDLRAVTSIRYDLPNGTRDARFEIEDIKAFYAIASARTSDINAGRITTSTTTTVSTNTNTNTNTNTEGTSESEENKKFVRKCPIEDCRGFLSTQWNCGTCEAKICCKCNERKTEDHVCNPDNVQTMELLKKDSKPCPKCQSLIFKISAIK